MSGTLDLELNLKGSRASREPLLVEGVVFPGATLVLSSAKGPGTQVLVVGAPLLVLGKGIFLEWIWAIIFYNLNLWLIPLSHSGILLVFPMSFLKFSFSAQIKQYNLLLKTTIPEWYFQYELGRKFYGNSKKK